jgi:hypothetical protein
MRRDKMTFTSDYHRVYVVQATFTDITHLRFNRQIDCVDQNGKVVD